MKVKLFFFISLLIFSYASYGTHYKVLGVSETATAEEIKMAYRKMSMKYHPDRAPKEKAELYGKKMTEINVAQSILLDPQKRIRYDQELREQRLAGFSGGTTARQSEAGETSTGESESRAYHFWHFKSSPNNKPFFTVPQQVNTSSIPNAEKTLSLFHLILANDLHFKQAFRGSVSDWKNINQTKKLSETALKEILRTMGISNMNKQTFQRILSDFYHNFSEERIKELLKENTSSASSEKQVSSKKQKQEFSQSQSQSLSIEETKALQQRKNILAQAFLEFITEVKEWYEVQELRPYERRAIEIFHTFSFLNKSPSELKKSEDRYIELLQKKGGRFIFKKNPLTKEERRELRAFEKQIRQDILIFRNVLSALGLPKDIHNDMLLRSYMEGLKDSLVLSQATEENSQGRSSGTKTSLLSQSGQSTDSYSANPEAQRGLVLSNRSSFFSGSGAYRGQTSNQSMYIKDKEIIGAIRDIKITLDESHYQNLKTMSPVFNKGFLKRFPPQFILLHTAFGAAIYREALTDSLSYGAEKNPEMLTSMLGQSITPSAIVSLAIFIAVSQQVHYRLYGGGRLMDGKTLKTPFGNVSFSGKTARAMSPSLGLGSGYFAYVIFSDLINDPHLGQCVKNQFQFNQQYEIQQHKDPCDAFLLTWWESEKWKHYSVDIAAIMGSSWLAHKLISRISLALQPLNLGGLLFRSGKFLAMRTYIGMAFQMGITLYTFVEIHKLLEEWLGKSLKEQLTAGAIKNSIQDFSFSLDKGISNLKILSFIKNEVEEPEELEHLSQKIKEQIARLGYKFKKWSEIKGLYYDQSVQLWSAKLNRLTQPYAGTLELLKIIFLSSQLKYGFELVEETSPIWDSKEDLVNNRDDWNQLNSESITFSFSSFAKMKDHQKELYCQISEYDDFFSGWKALCENDFGNVNDLSLTYETAFFILNVMDDFLSKTSTPVENFNFKPYIGKDFDEMFSSHPDYLIQNLSVEKKFQLSKALIEVGLDWTNSLSYFHDIEKEKWRLEMCNLWYPDHITNEETAELHNLCLKTPDRAESHCSSKQTEANSDSEEEYDKCMGFFNSVESSLSQAISTKLLRAGIYILKTDILKPLTPTPDSSYINPYQKLKRHPHHHFQLLSLAKLIEVYKKGERYFLQTEKILAILKETMDSNSFKEMKRQMSLADPHLLTYKLLCEKKEGNEEQFVSPPFFPSSSLSLYDFSSKQFLDIPSSCKELDSSYFLSKEKPKYIHQMLFQKPARMNNKRYENLYLALEDILRQSYSSSKNVEDSFYKLSQDQLNKIADQQSKNLNGLTEGYYKGLINKESEVNPYGSLEEFDTYYQKHKVFFDIRSFTGGGIRGLEISLFQVHYWMNVLKQLLQTGETLYFTTKDSEGKEIQISFNEEQLWMQKPFDEKAFKHMRWEVLSLLQSYHNTYKEEQGPYLVIPDEDFIEELQTSFSTKGREGLKEDYPEGDSQFAILQKKYSSSLPVFIYSDFILSHILESSIPNWNNPGQINNLNNNPAIANQAWEDLIYSVVFEINSSLNIFFSQMQALYLKESFDRSMSHFNPNLE